MLYYADTTLTVRRNSLLNRAAKLNSALNFITESQAMMSSLNITFGTLVSTHLNITILYHVFNGTAAVIHVWFSYYYSSIYHSHHWHLQRDP